MMLALLLASLLFLTGRGDVLGSRDGKSKNRQKQLERIKADVGRFEDKIKQENKREQTTLDILDSYERQEVALRKSISHLYDEQANLKNQINQTRHLVRESAELLVALRKQYSNYVSTAYQNGGAYDMELVISSGSLNQAYVRAVYLKNFSDQRKKDLLRIDNKRAELETQSALLEHQMAREKDLISSKHYEEAKFDLKVRNRKTILTRIRRDKKTLKKELNRSVQAAKDLQVLIAKLSENDLPEIKTDGKDLLLDHSSVLSPSVSREFESNRGRLKWPVFEGRISSRFGLQQNPSLHTLTQNPGIDIAVPPSTSVSSIADAQVSRIFWLPSYGNLIILSHRDGFRSVYAHLAEISVNEGDSVRAGQILGRSGESISGSVLHLELYKNREKLDPEEWLSPRFQTVR